MSRRSLVLGIHHYSRKDLEDARARGERLQIQVLGLATIADDVTPALALKTIESIVVLGTLRQARASSARSRPVSNESEES